MQDSSFRHRMFSFISKNWRGRPLVRQSLRGERDVAGYVVRSFRDIDLLVSFQAQNKCGKSELLKNSSAKRRVLLQVQRKGDSGSPRVVGSTSFSNALSRSGL
jgi:hypothetical protein